MKLRTTSFEPNRAIPSKYCFCEIGNPVSLANNLNPAFDWSDTPSQTQSFVMMMHDESVPTKPDDVNQEGREVPADLARADFYHWVLVDLDPSLSSLSEGEFSKEVSAHGKNSDSPKGICGLNDYTGWFEGDPDMEGQYFGYDGPCPPWNDSIIHHYHFTLYALDIKTCGLEGGFSGPDVLDAMKGHILDSASVSFTYTLNPRL